MWAQVILLIRDYKDPSVPLHVAMRHSAPFWLVVILTASIASSWMHLRKVKVQSEVLSNHGKCLIEDFVDLFADCNLSTKRSEFTTNTQALSQEPSPVSLIAL